MPIYNYISPCGGMKLTLDDVAVIDGKTTTRNENSSLFLAYTQRSNPDYEIVFRSSFHLLMLKTCIGRGRYSRRPGDAGLIRQSHDNLIGIAWLNVINGGPYIKDIVRFARWRLWNYCLTKFWDYRCQLQGSTVFVLKLAAGEIPGLLSALWWAGSLVVSDHSSDGYLRKMLQIDIVRIKQSLLSNLKKRICYWAIEMHIKRRGDVKRWYDEYFHEDSQHPARNGTFYENYQA